MRSRDTKKEVDSLRVGLRHKARMKVVPGPRDSVAFASMDLTGDLDGWHLDAEFELKDGQVVHGPVTFSPLGTVPIGSLRAAALRQLSMHVALDYFEDLLRKIEAEAPGLGTGQWIDALTVGRRPGKRGTDPYVVLLWARRRVEAEHEQPEAPIKWMVEQWGDLYSESQINKFIFRARDKGFLTPATKPVALTESAERLIKEDVDGER